MKRQGEVRLWFETFQVLKQTISIEREIQVEGLLVNTYWHFNSHSQRDLESVNLRLFNRPAIKTFTQFWRTNCGQLKLSIFQFSIDLNFQPERFGG